MQLDEQADMIFENRQGTEVEKLVGEAWIDRIDALLQFVPFLLAQGCARCDLFAQIDIVIGIEKLVLHFLQSLLNG